MVVLVPLQSNSFPPFPFFVELQILGPIKKIEKRQANQPILASPKEATGPVFVFDELYSSQGQNMIVC